MLLEKSTEHKKYWSLKIRIL